MRPARRQVEHVTRLQHVLLFWHEVGENLQWHTLLEVQVLLAPDAPAALAMGLQQEHVVAVEVGPHTATVGGVADHQIVQTRLRHEAELLHQRVHGIVVQIYALHQQSPARRLQRRQGAARKWTMAQSPAGLLVLDQARFDALLPCQGQQLRAQNRRRKAGDGLAYQQGLLMPVALHELRGRQAAEQGKGLVGFHGKGSQPRRAWVKLRQFSYGNHSPMRGRFDLDLERHPGRGIGRAGRAR